ncbi:2-polyprenylphenol 6-hydroxylase [Pararhizobium mangrovi]|uniref:2-polyprenylphenol 6-hydroxylase n=1 Tax=Pararhizobium mangrovi TaxID=2590452 RepID=A0A506TVI6_9HYPH|nr:2-polyprenylphenol 6-hydroxylase [Pararhizobium mangrovi]TPW26092.1 2-polyprenylphenol 6-hydroxylase [Pararhizobium mangrovi]
MSGPGAYFRLARVGWVFLREGVLAALPVEELGGSARTLHRLTVVLARPKAIKRARKDRLARAVEKLGPSYVKLGQFLATRPDVVGKDMALDLAMLQDEMETFPIDIAKQQIADSIGRPVSELYRRFDPPIAAASIAQVHPAQVADETGERKVAVKVIRPGIRKRFYHDLDTFYLIAHLQERFVRSARRLRPVEITKTLEQTTKIEMDLRLEAAALSELAENTADDPGFRVPKVDWERTGRDVVTMEWIDGIKMSNVEGLKRAGFDLNELADTLIQSFLRHTLRDGFFHADMHQGNIFVDHDGIIVAVDMGIVGRLGKKERRYLAEILYGFIMRDYRRVAEVHFEAGYVPRHHDTASFAQAIRAIGEPIHGQPAETISMARLLTLLFEVTELFDMQTQPQLIMLQKTMVVVEGVARTLNPRFNMWAAAEPVVGDWIRQNLGPARILHDTRDGLHALMRLVDSAPEILSRMDALSAEVEDIIKNGVRFDNEAVKFLSKAQATRRRVGEVALWILAGVALIAAVKFIW